MQLPQHYFKYIDGIALPHVLHEALKLYGTLEAQGDADSPTILGWAKEIDDDAGIQYDHDAIPWCGLFVAVCVHRAGFQLPPVAVRASSWDEWGDGVGVPSRGDVLRFQRKGGGHVGFYFGEDEDRFYVLGGNQSDAVTIAPISKDRLVSVRRCKWKVSKPMSVVPVRIENIGALSTNEA